MIHRQKRPKKGPKKGAKRGQKRAEIRGQQAPQTLFISQSSCSPHLEHPKERVGVPGCEGPQGEREHFQAGQPRRTLNIRMPLTIRCTWKGVGVPGCEGSFTGWTHFQAGQRTHLTIRCVMLSSISSRRVNKATPKLRKTVSAMSERCAPKLPETRNRGGGGGGGGCEWPRAT